jgi:iron complex outermembrane receptor protein
MTRSFERIKAGTPINLPAPVRCGHRRSHSVLALFPALFSLLAMNQSNAAMAAGDDFANLSLEELGNVQITSVSKKPERLADAAASIYVITSEDIHRSGVHTLPEALRLAPNLQVAQISANQYAISARGFNSSIANKLLVMIDGRAVYTPLYSGVFWDAQDVLMQDIDRIEVISGPGGTLWGANAVNGVINIITKKSSAATDGTLANVEVGNKGKGYAVRHGGDFGGDSGSYRFYAKFDDWRHVSSGDGQQGPDSWEHGQGGFRADWRGQRDDYTVQGDVYHGSEDPSVPGQFVIGGSNLLTRWTRKTDDGAELRVQSYFDRTTRIETGLFAENLNTWDLDVQYSLPEQMGKRTIFGGGYRVADDQVGNSTQLAFLPAHLYLHWANLFIQQEYPLWPDWQLTVGAKAESNDYTGVEFLPNVKLAWKLAEDKLLWTDLSRSVRAPSRLDTQVYSPPSPPYFIAGGPNFRSEIATTVDVGLRAQASKSWSYSIVAFHTLYNDLRSVDVVPDHTVQFLNRDKGLVDGLEAWTNYQLNKSWSFDAGAQMLRERFSGTDIVSIPPGDDPHAQTRIGVKWNIDDRQHLDVAVRHVGKLSTPPVPAYTATDVSYGWQISKTWEVSLIGRNVFDPRHEEFSSGTSVPILIERTVDLALTARF